MNTIKSFFTNPTVLSFLGLFLDGGLKSIEPSTPYWIQGIIGIIIVYIGIKFHVTEVAAAKAGASVV